MLSVNVEQPISEIIQAIKEPISSGDSIVVDNNLRQAVFNYLYGLISRSQSLLEMIVKKSAFLGGIDEQTLHDFAVGEGFQFLRDCQAFQEKYITFAINFTSVPFVLPLVGVYSYKHNQHEFWQMPVTPQIAIVLTEPAWANENIQNGKGFQLVIDDAKTINYMNEIACKSELSHGRKICISNDMEYLKTIIQKVKEEEKWQEL